ncbi:putative 26S protease regulatory subunit [Tolypocladium ophioglossoides CBS 100239]|uniref:Putative 26S protease regulatory subunit n=1 Tax=Tolypocladium ophioglossoides (strain CBS 100239) TaxID=1163406 RepID=A0A0L0N5W6_TOLOC|nr:putative 26S protease regulatory subunit [Tolypocladium ophioglossoides CBS 100239]
MRLRAIRDIDREDISDFVWKWRCKILRNKDAAAKKASDLESISEDDAKPATGKDPAFGSEAAVKTMYEGRNSSPSHYEWVDYPPKQLSKSAARVHDRVAFKVYKVKDRDKPCLAGRFPLKYHRIEVQNPALVAALEPILNKEKVHLDVNEVAQFKEPFRALWFCQEDIMALHKSADDASPLKSYLKLLLRIMDDMFSELRTKRKHVQVSGLVDFKGAWTLFPRGCTVYSYGLNSEFLCKVEGTQYIHKREGTFLFIKTKIMIFNGEEFVWQAKWLTMEEYEGNKPVKELQHYPISFHAEGDDITRRLISRGKKVLDLQGLRYCCYNGIALHSSGKDVNKHNVEGRILIDVMGYNKYHLAQGRRENKDPEIERYLSQPWDSADSNSWSDSSSSSSVDIFRDSDNERGAANRGKGKRLSEVQKSKNTKEMLAKEEDLRFMSGMIGGFALKNKIWVQFYIEDIEPMVWNDTAYSHLVYDSQQKDLVLSFVENHKPAQYRALSSTTADGKSQPMDDVILGKGQGLIILLSGPPGTGKTLTAEAVADRTHRPLFYLQAEDLGINAAALGANIKRVFEMATEWDAVILLDEADVFMAERNPNDIHRNELVSIFLRELEYFRGIIFLTTNLYNTIDTAFRSRVSLHLLFQALDRDARETVWRKFLNRLPEPPSPEAKQGASEKGKEAAALSERPLDDGDIRELSLWQLNGREIKNAVRMVRSWCDHKGYAMTLERLESGIRVTSPHTSKSGDVDDDLYD